MDSLDLAKSRNVGAFLALWVLVFSAAPSAHAQIGFRTEVFGTLDGRAGWETVSGQFSGGNDRDEVAFYDPATGQIFVAHEQPDGNLALSATPWITVSPAGNWELASGEFTGDGFDDLVGYQPSNGSLWVFESSGSGFTAAQWGLTTVAPNMTVQAGDFTGDGRADVAVYNPATGAIVVGVNNGLALPSSAFILQLWSTLAPASGWTLVAEEFTEDNRADLAGYHPNTGTLWIGASTGAAFSFTATSTTLQSPAGWELYAGQFDGVGAADLLAYYPSTGTIWLGLRDQTGFSFGPQPVADPFCCGAGWQIVPGQFDADGRLDLVAVLPAADQSITFFLLAQEDRSPLGYAWPLSASPGESIDFYITRGTGVVDFFRHRSSGSDVTSEYIDSTTFTPTLQSFCEATPDANLDGCGWGISLTHTIGPDWPSGMYSARAYEANGAFFDITFIVKPSPSETPTVAVLANVNTWNAYNEFGGGSKYAGIEGGSFMRPNRLAEPTGDSPGHDHLARGELWMLTWLEAEGYDPHLFTDIDFHNGEVLGRYDYLVLNVHPEYWTIEMWDQLQLFLSGGGSLLYIAGNGIYEEAVFGLGGQSLTFLGGVRNGSRADVLLRNYQVIGPNDEIFRRAERRLTGVATTLCAAPGVGFYVERPSHPIYAGLGLSAGDTFGTTGFNTGGGLYNGAASAWEVDTRSDPGVTDAQGALNGGCVDDDDVPPSLLPPGLVRLADAGTQASPQPGAEIVYYSHPAGGHVLSIGSITATGSLVVDPVLQQMVRNFFSMALPSAVPSILPLGLVGLLVGLVGAAVRKTRP